MSISTALSNAYSGLSAASRSAETVSQNVANALTEGYGRREVQLSAASVGGQGSGVRVSAVVRQVDMALISTRRQAQANAGADDIFTSAYAGIDDAIGLPGNGDSLVDLVAGFESALISAASRPDLGVRQQNIVFAAKDLISHINTVSSKAQELRQSSDAAIAQNVNVLNATLAEVAQLNRDIRLEVAAGRDANGLKDQRQVLVDGIADIIPMKTQARDHGQVALISTGGAVLLDGSAAVFGFSPVGIITADMSLASGALSGITMNGKPVPTGSVDGLLAGGTLMANFAVRDKLAPEANQVIDTFAQDLIARFEDSGLDPSVATGSAGLFTDNGSALDVSNVTGLAGRLTLNAIVDPDNGGDLWRLRAGLGATSEGEVGDTTLLTAFADKMSESRPDPSGFLGAREMSAAGFAAALASHISASHLAAARSQTYSSTRLEQFKLAEFEGGVDTDQEMQRLLLVEKAFAANARVISTADDMLATLLEI